VRVFTTCAFLNEENAVQKRNLAFADRGGCVSVLTDLVRQFNTGSDAETPAVPDALSLIHNDHEEVAGLFKIALSDAATPAAKRAAIAKVCFALTVHAKMEEKIFYPALRKAGKKDERDSVLEAAEEHGVAKDLIAKIKRIKGRDETLEAKVTVLKELVEHHVREEESTIFAEARKVLGKRLDALGAEMQRFKERSGAAPRPVRAKSSPSSRGVASPKPGPKKAKAKK
jgi:hemerythrin superfamily protein